jgi:hypothetical protein
MATEISVFDSDEFEELVSMRDLRISKALVETILKNLKGRKRHLHALSVLVEQAIYEKYELYEGCAEIVKAIKFLKDKIKK